MIVLLMKYPGRAAPAVADMRFATTPSTDTSPTCLGPNQFIATLLGVLRMKMFPMAAREEPRRHQVGLPTVSKIRSHTPAVTRIAPMRRQTPIPILAIMRLQGKAKRGVGDGEYECIECHLRAIEPVDLLHSHVNTGECMHWESVDHRSQDVHRGHYEAVPFLLVLFITRQKYHIWTVILSQGVMSWFINTFQAISLIFDPLLLLLPTTAFIDFQNHWS